MIANRRLQLAAIDHSQFTGAAESDANIGQHLVFRIQSVDLGRNLATQGVLHHHQGAVTKENAGLVGGRGVELELIVKRAEDVVKF